MNRIMILGASTLQVPAIKAAKELGFHVGVIDYDPKAPGIQFADAYYNISTIDTDKIIEAVKDFGANGIMTMATDMPMRSIAKTCEELQLPGISFETAVNSTDKYKMMKAFEKYSVPHPWFYKVDTKYELMQVINKIEYPCVMKPIDNSGSRGVTLVRSNSDLSDAYNYSTRESRSGSIIIQEYMEGQEVSVEIMVQNNEPHVLAITDKITTGAPHFVEMGHSQPTKLSIDYISEVAKKAVIAVGINRGPAHVEIMVTPSGPKVIELGARLGGDYITSHLVPLSTGIDMVSAAILDSCDMKFSLEQKQNKVSMIKYFTTSTGKIKDIQGVEESKKIPGVVDIKIFKKIGDFIGDIHSSNDRVGCVIVQGEDYIHVEKICSEVLKNIKIKVRKNNGISVNNLK